MDFTLDIHGRTLEYLENEHLYLVDGIIVPRSITGLVTDKVGFKYADVDPETLKRAAERGTRIHDGISSVVLGLKEPETLEEKNFRFLLHHHHLEAVQTEIPVILFYHEDPVAAGRLDLVLRDTETGLLGGADIKTTATLDKDYLFWQLNLYRIAYYQCYGAEWQFLRGIHLRDDVRKVQAIPINEEMTMEFIQQKWSEQYE